MNPTRRRSYEYEEKTEVQFYICGLGGMRFGRGFRFVPRKEFIFAYQGVRVLIFGF
jgi:hypothetical protein